MAFGGNVDKLTNSQLQDLVSRGLTQFVPIRVTSVDQSDSLSNGDIVGEILTPQATPKFQLQVTATPLFPNITYVPLVNEVVFCISSPAGSYGDNTSAVKYYYISPLNIWNNTNTNPTPNPYQDLKPNSQNKSIAEIEAGSSNKSSKTDTNLFKPGTYFEEKSNIYPLYPYEGDIIYEGRWGQSIRFGSTNVSYTSKTKKTQVDRKFEEKTNYPLGGIDPTTVFVNKINLLNSKVGQFFDQYEEDKISIYVESSESQVTNPNNIAKGELAKIRAERIKTLLESYSNLRYNITTSYKIGNIPYTQGVDDPNNPKYLDDQYTSVKVLVQGVEITEQPSNPVYLNSWSTTGSVGDPILIFRNGQNPELPSPAQSTTLEDINKDISSLYFTSTQKVPIEVSSQNDYLSYGTNKPEDPKEYAGAQVILNSGRLVFNTTQNHILLSSAKSINLNAVEGIYTDTTGDTVFQSNKVYLGGTQNAQPVVLGDELVSLLTDVLNDLSNLTNSLQNQIGVPVGSPIAPTNLIAQTINFKINGYKQRLKNSLSNTTSTV